MKKIIILLVIVAFAGTINCSSKNKIKPRIDTIVEAVYALGTVKSDDVYSHKMGIPSTITHLHVKEGQTVPRGAILFSTDAGASFYAPFTGTVTRLYCEEKEIVLSGMTVLTMMDLGKTYIQVSLDQNSALRIRKNQTAQLSVETIRGTKLSGVVESIYPSNGQFLARIRVAKMPPEVLPEMTADVAIEVARREKALLIPLTALKNGMCTIYRKGDKQIVNVKIGAIDGKYGEVLNGTIRPDDVVILNNK